MITGFNTDIEHDGVIYHVQTEDKGLESPIILSLVYTGGTILASKRSPYQDLIAKGYSDEALAERLKRQHRLICAAIHSGRIDDLKKMSARVKETPAPIETVAAEVLPAEPTVEPEQAEATAQPATELEFELETERSEDEATVTPAADEQFEIEYWPVSQEWAPPPPTPPREAGEMLFEGEMQPGYEPGDEQAPYEHFDDVGEPILEDGLYITLLDDDEFYSGQRYTLRVFINSVHGGKENPIPNAAVSVKILGTTFRPLIYTVKTESDGVATVDTEIPEFTSGRAAVLVRVILKDESAEMRCIIHPAD